MSPGRKFALLASLYLAQGLPFGFFSQALPVVLRERGLSLAAIGASGLLFLPWALKFLWGPWVDHVGTRRRWILGLQLLTVLGALAVSRFNPDAGLMPLFMALLLFNLLASTQDVATDGIAVRLLTPSERGLGNGVQVGAYRLGMIVGGGALLWWYAMSGWTGTFVTMAVLLALASIPAVLWAPREQTPPAEARPPLRELLGGWALRLRVAGLPAFILLVCAYKFGDAMASSLVSPFMVDAAMSTAQIALVKGTIGSVMGLAGAALGGWMAWKLGRRRALIACGVLQTASLSLYVACALQPGSHALIYVASTAEHLLGGMATVALFTLLMDAADPEQASTDYTLLACAVLLGGGLAGVSGGLLGDAFGYAPMFALATALSGLGCLALVLMLDRGHGPARLCAVWPGAGQRAI